MKKATNPLRRGFSARVLGENIGREIERGRDPAQAVAIAFETARKAYRARHPRGPLPSHLQAPKRRRNPDAIPPKPSRPSAAAKPGRRGTKRAPARRGYVAHFGKKKVAFNAQSDAAAVRYATGLLAAKVGRAPSDLFATGVTTDKKKSRR